MGDVLVRVGLLGGGTVGRALVELIEQERDAIAERTGLRLEVARVLVRDAATDRAPIDRAQLTTEPADVVSADDVQVVVEVMGGVDPARELVLAALAAGKPVVSANKELLASHADELEAAAQAAGVDLLYEAAVAGGIPIVRALRESLVGEPISRVLGIVNGTTNYILTAMAEHGTSYGDALAEAQALGYAEADPTADVSGRDAAAKVAIIASLAFGRRVIVDDVAVEGITGITPDDHDFAARHDMVVKLLAACDQIGSGDDARIAVRVHPALVPLQHPLASVRGSFNAVFVEGAAVDQLMFYGPGAGGGPTASAVLGDLVDAAGNLHRRTAAPLTSLPRATVEPQGDLVSQYYVHLVVEDRPGVLSSVAGVFGERGISIRSMEQDGELGEDGSASLGFITYRAREADLAAVLDDLRNDDAVRRVGRTLRLVGT